jgi:hypothetical protein
VPSDLVDLALGCGSNTQNGGRTTGDLRAACIMDDLRAKSQANGLSLQHEHIVFAVDLERHLGLAKSLPALQHWMRRVCANERLVACESGMSALRGNLACCEVSAISIRDGSRGRVTQAMASSYQQVRAKVAENVMLERFCVHGETYR